MAFETRRLRAKGNDEGEEENSIGGGVETMI